MLMYPDSILPVKFVIRIYLILTGLTMSIFRRSLWPVHVPSYLWVKGTEATKKADYKLESSDYRFLHSNAMEGLELNKTYYWYYATLARKYGRPFVKEIYDKMPELETRQFAGLPKYSKPWGPVRTMFGFDIFISALVVMNFLANDTYPGDTWYMTIIAAVMLAVFMQVFFLPIFVIIKLSQLQQRRSKHNT